MGRYIADFYCHKARLIIELEGDVHLNLDQRQYDAVREDVIEQLGIQVLHFDNDDVIHELNAVLNRITEALEHSVSPLP